MKRFDVTALGELLIDFTESGKSPQGNPLVESNPGGAPCNVLAMLNKLGKKTAFIGKVGNDAFGRQLSEAVGKSGTDISGLVTDNDVHTTLAFVHTLSGGEREFSFYRNPGADMMLRKDEVKEDIIKSARIFHFGTLSLTHDSVREATRYAVDIAKKNNLLVSFDPNLREPLWNSLNDAKVQIEYGLSKCDILKISDNELEFITGTCDYQKGAKLLLDTYKIPIIFVTMGKEGSLACYKDAIVFKETFSDIKPIEKTGAGDTFTACAINYILDNGLDNLSENNLSELLTFANAAASIITTRKGALNSMPEREEIEALINLYKV